MTKSAAKRVSWLDRECGDDESLRQRLDALLAAHDQPDELPGDGIEKTKVMETIKVEFTDELANVAVGQTRGLYKLLERVSGMTHLLGRLEQAMRRPPRKSCHWSTTSGIHRRSTWARS